MNENGFKKLIHTALKFVFPEKCLGCGSLNQGLICPICFKKIPGSWDNTEIVKAAGSYESETLRKAVRLLKYRRVKKIAPILAELIHQRVFLPGLCPNEKAVLIPVPLSKKRLSERGFNQAELIAQALAEKSRLEMETGVLLKIRHTRAQVEMKSRKKRMKNIKNTLFVRDSQAVKNRTIFLIDDVATTGATLSEAAKVLKKAGARKVIGIVVAK